MPSYPQQFSEGVYYVPPPDTQPNPFAAFWHGWHQTRSPYARALFEARLRALDPGAQYALLAKLYEQRTRLLEGANDAQKSDAQMRITEQQGSDSRFRAMMAAWGQVTSAAVTGNAAIIRGELDARTELAKAGHLNDQGVKALDEYQSNVNNAVRLANGGNHEAAMGALRESTRLLQERHALINETDPFAADALARAAHVVQMPIQDPTVAGAARAGVSASIPNPPQQATPNASRLGVPAFPSWASPGGGGAGSPDGPGQLSPTGTGRQPVQPSGGVSAPFLDGGSTSTSTRTSTRTPAAITPIAAQLLGTADALDADIQQVRDGIQDPRDVLGGFWDPIPGRPGRGARTAAERIAGPQPSLVARPSGGLRAAAAPAGYSQFAPNAAIGNSAPGSRSAPSGGSGAAGARPSPPSGTARPPSAGSTPDRDPTYVPLPTQLETYVPLPTQLEAVPSSPVGPEMPRDPSGVPGLDEFLARQPGEPHTNRRSPSAESLGAADPFAYRPPFTPSPFNDVARDDTGTSDTGTSDTGTAPSSPDPSYWDGAEPPEPPGSLEWGRQQFISEFVARNPGSTEASAAKKWSELSDSYREQWTAQRFGSL